MVQTSKIIVQPLNFFDSASFETSFIKIKGTFKIGLYFLKKTAPYGLQMV